VSAPLPPLKVGQYHVARYWPAGRPDLERLLEIKRTSARSYILRVVGTDRARWASGITEVRSDLAHFQATGALPAPTGTSWA
jgi:hypothetical protein